MNIEEVLIFHAEKYPLIQPADAVKLLYQNEFGGGHLLQNPDASLAYLMEEYKNTGYDEKADLAVPLGNGIVRFNLAAIDGRKLTVEWLNEAVVQSSALIKGTHPSFCRKLKTLEMLTEKHVFSFSSDALCEYLDKYQAAGYPIVSHSAVYRKAYLPAYRIVLEKLIP